MKKKILTSIIGLGLASTAFGFTDAEMKLKLENGLEERNQQCDAEVFEAIKSDNIVAGMQVLINRFEMNLAAQTDLNVRINSYDVNSGKSAEEMQLDIAAFKEELAILNSQREQSSTCMENLKLESKRIVLMLMANANLQKMDSEAFIKKAILESPIKIASITTQIASNDVLLANMRATLAVLKAEYKDRRKFSDLEFKTYAKYRQELVNSIDKQEVSIADLDKTNKELKRQLEGYAAVLEMSKKALADGIYWNKKAE